MARADNIDMVKKLLGNNDNISDALIEFALDNASEIIKNYCNIKSVPAELNLTLIRMGVDLYRNEKLGSSDVPQNVTGVTIGDTSTSFGNISSDYSATLLKNYTKVLNRYRRVVFK